MLAHVRAVGNNYIRSLPEDVPHKMLQGAAIVGTVTLLSGYSSRIACATAAISAATTVVEAMTRPLTRSIVRNHDQITLLISSLFSNLLVLRIASAVSPLFAMGNAAYVRSWHWLVRNMIETSTLTAFDFYILFLMAYAVAPRFTPAFCYGALRGAAFTRINYHCSWDNRAIAFI